MERSAYRSLHRFLLPIVNALRRLNVAAMQAECRANAYLSLLSPPMHRQDGPERPSFPFISFEGC